PTTQCRFLQWNKRAETRHSIINPGTATARAHERTSPPEPGAGNHSGVSAIDSSRHCQSVVEPDDHREPDAGHLSDAPPQEKDCGMAQTAVLLDAGNITGGANATDSFGEFHAQHRANSRKPNPSPLCLTTPHTSLNKPIGDEASEFVTH